MKLDIWRSVFFTIIYLILSEILGLFLLLAIFFEDEINIYFWADSLLYLFYHLLLLFVVILVLKKIKGFEEIFPKNTVLRWGGIALSLLLGVVFVFFQDVLNHFYDLFFSSSYFANSETAKLEFKLFRIPKLLASIFIVPVIQELFFRGFIFKGLAKRYSNIYSLIISSLLFASIHIDYHHIYIAFFGGLIGGVLYLRTKELIYPILFHLAWNLVVILDRYLDVIVF